MAKHFKKKVECGGQPCSWITVIREKTRELANHITDLDKPLDFTDPSPILERKVEAA